MTVNSTSNTRWRRWAPAALAFAVIAGGGWYVTRSGGPVLPDGPSEAVVGGPFALTAHTGERVTDADFRGRGMLIYFGFTFCPDVCPISLQVMGAGLDQLTAPERARVQPLFISLDPERDTPEAMAHYVRSNGFPDTLIGLTGAPAAIDQVVKAYRVYYQKVETPESAADYLVDHSSIIFLMDDAGDFVRVFSHDTAPETLAQGVRDWLSEADA